MKERKVYLERTVRIGASQFDDKKYLFM